MDYQVMPPLTEDEYEELKADIALRGLMVPVEYDEFGNILDGHHRVRACKELGITAWPRLVRIGLNDEAKRAHARALNLARRHLNQDQKRGLIRDQLKDTPEKSDRQIARQLGVSDKTIGAVRHELEGIAEIPQCDRQTSDGRIYPATRATKPRTVFLGEETIKEAATLPSQIEHSILVGDVKLTEAKRRIRRNESQSKAEAIPDGKYRIIYADPPWTYNDQRMTGDHRESTAATYHYGTMSHEELKSLPIRELSFDDSVLFCWATFPLLKEAIDLIESWGFKYKTAFVWDKGRGAFGHYHNAAAELLLVATKGSCTPDAEKKEDQVQSFNSLGHSRKPEQWRELIDRLYPHGPRIELFHRGEKPEGWSVWGSESNGQARNS